MVTNRLVSFDSIETEPTPPLCWGKVLLVDDSNTFCLLAVAHLQHRCSELVILDSGVKAIQLVRQEAFANRSFTIIIMDLQLPVVSGIESIRMIRRFGFVGAVIALSACHGSELQNLAVAVGSDLFIEKPFDWTSLADAIDAVLRKRGLHTHRLG